MSSSDFYRQIYEKLSDNKIIILQPNAAIASLCLITLSALFSLITLILACFHLLIHHEQRRASRRRYPNRINRRRRGRRHDGLREAVEPLAQRSNIRGRRSEPAPPAGSVHDGRDSARDDGVIVSDESWGTEWE